MTVHMVSKPERHSRDMGGGVVWERQSQHTHTNETCTLRFKLVVLEMTFVQPANDDGVKRGP